MNAFRFLPAVWFSSTLPFLLALGLVARGATAQAAAPAGAAVAGTRVVTVYVVLEDDPVAVMAQKQSPRTLLGTRVAEARAHGAQLQARQAELQGRLQALGAEVNGRFTRVANALRVRVPENRVADVASLPGVRRVQLARLYQRHLGVSLPFVGVPPVWSSAGGGIDGRGLRVGIIDSGIDYTHADFGGDRKSVV